MAEADGVRRRDFINIAAVRAAGVAGVGVVIPLVSQMSASADVLAASSTEVDISSIQPGQAIKAMFRKQSFPPVVMNPQDANREFIRGNVELVRLSEAEGRIAAEGALPYPPGVLCVVPGELWGGAVLRYFLALEEGVNMLPGFSPELQGVYSETDADGIKRLYGYVLKA